MKKISTMLLVFLFVLGFVGCGESSQEPAPSTEESGILDTQTLAVTNMEFELADASHITVHHFSLGTLPLAGMVWDADTQIHAPAQIPAPLDGIIAIPDGDGAHPLVVLLHGNTETRGIHDPVYAGFDFLVAQLAAEGYIAVSINIIVDFAFEVEVDGQIVTGESNAHEWAYALFNAHIDALYVANAGEETPHGIDLTGRILVDEIHLIGHSRGGMIGDMFYRHDRDAGITRIRSLTRVGTSTYIFDPPYYHPNIPTAILLAQFDGDLTTPFGQTVFDQILEQSSSIALVQLTYLQGANHNFFNGFFEEDDRITTLEEYAALFSAHEDTWLTREEQETFLKHYVTAFLAVVTQRQVPFSTFHPSEAQPATMFGFPVRASTYVPPATKVEVTQGEVSDSALVENYVQRWGGGGLFRHPLADPGTDELALISLSWTEVGAFVSLIPQTTDFSAYQALSLYVAVDSGDERNQAGKPQSFTLILTDASGAAQALVIPPQTAALYFHIGEEVPPNQYLDFSTWRGYMPFSELRIPLTYFTELALDNIVSITFQFDQTPLGAIMLRDIFLK